MKIRELSVPDAYEVTTVQHSDDRGTFLELFKEEQFAAAVGHPLRLAQANVSVSRRGTIRGLHFAQVPPGQAKYVTCLQGAVLDVVVDIRVVSPTFGVWDAMTLDDSEIYEIYVAVGLGHAFMTLTETSVVSYLCSAGYAPGREHGVHPLDPDLGILWPDGITPLLSPKDQAAPGLAEAEKGGLLPTYAKCQAHYRALRSDA